jgi:Flp pilus assembly protein TadB
VADADDAQVGRLRQLGRLTVVAVGLWFICDGLSAYWSPLGVIATGMFAIGVVLALVFVVAASRYYAGRRRQD